MHGPASSTFGFRLLFGSSHAGQNNWLTVGKFSHKRQLAAHGLNGLAESGKQEIAALFETRNTVLGYTESLGHANLRELAGVPQFAQGHFLGNQLSGAGFDLLALGGAQVPAYVA